MAVAVVPSSRFLSAFLPVALASLRPATAAPSVQSWRRFPIRETASALPIAIGSGISSLLHDIWGSILRAVPKKKTTHSKKRHRQLAGKALQDVTALNKCSGCGRQKRAHALCPYCVQTIRQYWGTNWKPTPELEAEQKEKKEKREEEEESRKHAKDMKWWPVNR
ncbi:MAG: hypothetical protein M1821_006002 [Bathelium mastoideum]|nr:MAG: hypothetical protein M1821_006002 [Bathelium mastoideum]